uniref:Uncharacterized protein n=1 Tax=Opuntia streptacantha TaxID=393608 RepID=A0A7C9DR77_OPUST
MVGGPIMKSAPITDVSSLHHRYRKIFGISFLYDGGLSYDSFCLVLHNYSFPAYAIARGGSNGKKKGAHEGRKIVHFHVCAMMGGGRGNEEEACGSRNFLGSKHCNLV